MGRTMSRPQRGVSLIEAMVALGVMAFGIMGLVGIQTSLRAASDISKQRAEASRYAQQMLEDRRHYLAVASTGGDAVIGYADVTSTSLGNATGSNASFARTVTVSDSAAARMKLLRGTVTWTDRAGQAQTVQMTSMLGGVSPELAATVGIPALSSTGRLPQGRNLGIPRRATDMGDGTSRFAPPGGDTLRWFFNNQTGYITRICPTTSTCVDVDARLLAGFVRFELGSAQPTSGDAEEPTDDGPGGLEVVVYQTSPTAQTVQCFEDDQDEYVAYYCAVPVTTATPNWSGRSEVLNLTLASSIASNSSSQYRVCRYTTTRAQTTVPTISNADHPLNYLNVDVGLQNQNFLVIRAGNDTSAFDCPADDTSTPLVNGNTWHHQPSL